MAMNEQKYTYRAQWLVLIGAGLLLLVLFGAWISEGLNKEWRKSQNEYEDVLERKLYRKGLRGAMHLRGVFFKWTCRILNGSIAVSPVTMDWRIPA